jgi:hypothetical protein
MTNYAPLSEDFLKKKLREFDEAENFECNICKEEKYYFIVCKMCSFSLCENCDLKAWMANNFIHKCPACRYTIKNKHMPYMTPRTDFNDEGERRRVIRNFFLINEEMNKRGINDIMEILDM